MSNNTDKAIGVFQGLPSYAKGVIVIAITAGIMFAGYKGYTYFQKQQEDKKNKQEADDASKEFDRASKTDRISFPPINYITASNSIQQYLNGCELTNAEIGVVEEIMKTVKKPIDWYYLVKTFGNRDIDDCGAFGMAKTNYGLITLLKQQLGTYVVAGTVLGKAYYNTSSYEILTKYLKSIGITI